MYKRTPHIRQHMEKIGRTMHCNLGVFAMIFGAASLGLSADSPRAIYEQAKRSTFLIETFDAKGIPLGLGTGFAVSSNHLASNGHVLRGAQRVTAKNLDTARPFTVKAVVGFDLQADLVLLRIEGPAMPLVIDTNLTCSVGDNVYALGNPRGLEGTFSAGIISAKREDDNVQSWQITAPISPGSSGGPVLSSAGTVIGVATSAIKEAQNLNFAVSAKHLLVLLRAEHKEDSIADFSAKQETIARKRDEDNPARSASEADLLIRDFMWSENGSGTKEFSFTVFNGMNRPVRRVLAVVSFLNQDLHAVDTQFIPIQATILPNLAVRAKGSVDGSVYALNQLRDPQYADLDETTTEAIRTFTLVTNSITVKWKGKFAYGFKATYSINGKKATQNEYEKLWRESKSKMQVMRVLDFEYADF